MAQHVRSQSVCPLRQVLGGGVGQAGTQGVVADPAAGAVGVLAFGREQRRTGAGVIVVEVAGQQPTGLSPQELPRIRPGPRPLSATGPDCGARGRPQSVSRGSPTVACGAVARGGVGAVRVGPRWSVLIGRGRG